MDIATILSLVQFAIQEEPAIQTALTNVFTKGAKPEDWQAEHDRIAALNFDTLVPNVPKS